jgi:hypothetical protein
MKEFTIEDYTITNENSVNIDYYFYSKSRFISFTEDQIREALNFSNLLQFEEYLREEFNSDDCEKLLKYYIREYAKEG